jgi:cytochrome c oxidase assembly factor CtaG
LGQHWRRLSLPKDLVLKLASFIWLLHTAVLWLWHTPLFFEAALRNDAIHGAEHLCFLAAAWLLWWTALEPAGGHRHYGISVLIIFLTALQGGILGALLTFSVNLWYPLYAPPTIRWGLSPLEDQQLAGVLMWVPSALVYLGAAAGLFTAWLAAIEQGVRRRERMTGSSIIPRQAHVN